jgi:hypothetical protein
VGSAVSHHARKSGLIWIYRFRIAVAWASGCRWQIRKSQPSSPARTPPGEN